MAGFPAIYGLTQPRNDISVLRAVLNQHWRVLVQDFRSLNVQTKQTVEQLLKSDPRKVVSILRQPTVSCLIGASRRNPKFLHELDLTILNELDQQLPSTQPWPVIHSLSTRTIRRTPDEAPEIAYHPIVGPILLATSDNNPLLSVQGHPDRAGNQIDLGDRPLDEWLSSLRAAFALIERYQPLIFEEMKLALAFVAPVGFAAETHFSVSYEESVGALYMTLHPNVMTMTEALIHEFQHNKLNAVFRWDPVLHNAHAPLYSSPVRPDPRPLHGVLMAVHAFQPVAKLYEAMTEADDPITKGRDWKKRFRQIIDINREGAETVLTHGRATAVGAGLLQEIRELDAHYAYYAAERLSVEEPAR